MSKSDEVKAQMEHLQSRVWLLTETKDRLNIFEGMNDGKFLEDSNKRLTAAKIKLEKYIEDNIEYVL